MQKKDITPQKHSIPETLGHFLHGLQEVINRLKSSQFNEMELSTENWSIRLAKNNLLSSNHNMEDLEFKDEQYEELEPQEFETKLQGTAKVVPVKSSLVGLFWSSPSRNGSFKILSGDKVAEGQVLGGIEAVNIMHSINAPASGRILEVLVEEGDPVEYGQFLFLLETEKEEAGV